MQLIILVVDRTGDCFYHGKYDFYFRNESHIKMDLRHLDQICTLFYKPSQPF